jgi:cytochrome c-type biogenesis protein CcmF
VRLRWAFAASLLTALLLPLILGKWKALVSLGLLLSLWIASTVALGFWDRLKSSSSQLTLLQKLRMQSRSYFGMQVAHIGVAVFIVGVSFVTQYETEKNSSMSAGDVVNVAGYDFKFNGVTPVMGPNYRAFRANIEVSRGKTLIRTMNPEKRIYNAQENAMTESSIDTGLFRDLYVSLGDPINNGRAWSVVVHYKPFVDWIWGGALLMAIGGGLAISDRRYALAAKKSREAVAAVKPTPAPAVARVSEAEASN